MDFIVLLKLHIVTPAGDVVKYSCRKVGDFMDIAGLSMAMSSARTSDAFGVAMLAKSLDQAETTGSQVVGMMDAAAMELSVNPHIGGNFDMTV